MLSGHVLAMYHLYYSSLTQLLHVIFCVTWPFTLQEFQWNSCTLDLLTNLSHFVYIFPELLNIFVFNRDWEPLE